MIPPVVFSALLLLSENESTVAVAGVLSVTLFAPEPPAQTRDTWSGNPDTDKAWRNTRY